MGRHLSATHPATQEVEVVELTPPPNTETEEAKRSGIPSYSPDNSGGEDELMQAADTAADKKRKGTSGVSKDK